MFSNQKFFCCEEYFFGIPDTILHRSPNTFIFQRTVSFQLEPFIHLILQFSVILFI